MKRLAPLLMLLLLLPACKESGWTFLNRGGGQPEIEAPEPGRAPPEPEQPKPGAETPPVETGQDTRDIIFVLGIDGMD
jgi:hypothetical protein